MILFGQRWRNLGSSRSTGSVTPTLNFDAGLTTFTPSAAKRNSAGPFAAGPAAQGDWATASGDADTVTFTRGTQISGNFYANFDSDQFWIVQWVTPEWAGNDGIEHVFLQWSANGFIRKTAGNNLELSVASGVSITTSISSWTAGTTYRVEVRGDADNTLDGTNYLCISIDDVHTFGRSSSYTAEEPAATIYIGSNSSGQNPANAIQEGLTVYRRPGWDGANGINASYGVDEVALTGDKTDTTGAWSVVFCLPTNATAGALATGTGNAWSQVHNSNLITPADGFMTSTAWANWSAEGTPTTPALLATGEKIFNGGYKFTSDAANEGYYFDVTVSAGDDWVVRALAHSDGTSQPKIILYDQTNTSEIGSLTGTTTSTRTAPDVFNLTGEAPAGCTTLRVKCINVAASGVTHWHQVEVYANLVSDPSMETGGGNPFIPSGFDNSGIDAGETEQEATIVNSGSFSLKWNTGASNEGIQKLNAIGGIGKYTCAGIAYYSNGGNIQFGGIPDGRTARNDGTTNGIITISGSASWSNHFVVLRGVSGAQYLKILAGSGASGTRFTDDIYSFVLDDVTLTVTPASQANSDEATGRRVDGRDTLTQSITAITTTSGIVKWKYTPRHSAADALKFIEVTDVYIGEFYGDATNYIRVFWNAANTITLAYSMASTTDSGTWDATGAIVAGTSYEFELEYAGGGNMTLKVGGTTRITLTSIPAAFGTALVTAYWGSRQNGDRQADATYGAPA